MPETAMPNATADRISGGCRSRSVASHSASPDAAMAIVGLDHVQLAMPEGGEARACTFYCGVLGMAELPKPAHLAVNGGCWFESGGARVHLGVEEQFRPARKAHPAA